MQLVHRLNALLRLTNQQRPPNGGPPNPLGGLCWLVNHSAETKASGWNPAGDCSHGSVMEQDTLH